tara:strand:- start:138 stop:347 length:210 start_codon:yes stop_codon:yes gene_type:complete
MSIFNIKTFKDKQFPRKHFHHVSILGFKFRIAVNTRGYKKYGTYKTSRGRVINVGRKYICFMLNRGDTK